MISTQMSFITVFIVLNLSPRVVRFALNLFKFLHVQPKPNDCFGCSSMISHASLVVHVLHVQPKPNDCFGCSFYASMIPPASWVVWRLFSAFHIVAWASSFSGRYSFYSSMTSHTLWVVWRSFYAFPAGL